MFFASYFFIFSDLISIFHNGENEKIRKQKAKYYQINNYVKMCHKLCKNFFIVVSLSFAIRRLCASLPPFLLIFISPFLLIFISSGSSIISHLFRTNSDSITVNYIAFIYFVWMKYGNSIYEYWFSYFRWYTKVFAYFHSFYYNIYLYISWNCWFFVLFLYCSFWILFREVRFFHSVIK